MPGAGSSTPVALDLCRAWLPRAGQHSCHCRQPVLNLLPAQAEPRPGLGSENSEQKAPGVAGTPPGVLLPGAGTIC